MHFKRQTFGKPFLAKNLAGSLRIFKDFQRPTKDLCSDCGAFPSTYSENKFKKLFNLVACHTLWSCGYGDQRQF